MSAPRLTIGIPTWNRAEHLVRAVDSIAAQHWEGGDVEVLIADNASDDDTAERLTWLADLFSWLRPYRFAVNEGGEENIRRLARLARGEYLWLLGDDDVLLPGAIGCALEALESSRPAFMHCAVGERASMVPALRAGSGLELVNVCGWLDLMGFISTCAARIDVWRAGLESPRWALYCEGVFPHALALLEQLVDQPAVILDRPMVATQDAKQTPETLRRWAANRTAERYVLVADALERLVADGVLPGALEHGFFRYHRTYLWAKVLWDLVRLQLAGHPQRALDQDTWRRLDALACLVNDAAMRAKLQRQFAAVRGALAEQRAAEARHLATVQAIDDVLEPFRAEAFPYALTAAAEREAA